MPSLVWVGEGVDGGGGAGQVDQVEVVDLGVASGGANLVGCPFGALAVGVPGDADITPVIATDTCHS